MSPGATLECPHCGHAECPMRHTRDSSCGGTIAFHSGTLRCNSCDTRITLFRCDECGRELDQSNVS